MVESWLNRVPPRGRFWALNSPRRARPSDAIAGGAHEQLSRAVATARPSPLVTTYQAGKLVLVRDEGGRLNTHFRTFQAPMGMALAGDRLAVGTKIQSLENSFVVPDAALADVSAALRAPAEPTRRTSPVPANGSAPREMFVRA